MLYILVVISARWVSSSESFRRCEKSPRSMASNQIKRTSSHHEKLIEKVNESDLKRRTRKVIENVRGEN